MTVSYCHFLECHHWTSLSPSSAALCPVLEDLANGMIRYDTEAPYPVGTIATHSCDAGFMLGGSSERTCIQEGANELEGIWTETMPSCECKNSYAIAMNCCSPASLYLQPPVQLSVALLVEWCSIQCHQNLVVSTQWVQWPPSPVMLALSCLETRQGPVSQTTCGPTVTPLVRVCQNASIIVAS